MAQVPFSRPLLLKLQHDRVFAASTPHDALDYLDRHWPGRRTAHFRHARALCEATVNGSASIEEARGALRDAAQRASLLVEDWTPATAQATESLSARWQQEAAEEVDDADPHSAIAGRRISPTLWAMGPQPK